MHYLKPFYDNEHHNHIKWDEWQEFHHNRGYGHPFVRFATDELIVKRMKYDPAHRRRYYDYDVSIVNTADAECPPLFFKPQPRTSSVNPDKPIPTAWLTDGGGQTLLVDHGKQIAVSLERSISSPTTVPLPKRFKSRCAAYFAGVGEEPISHSQPIKISKPWRHDDPKRNEHKRHIESLIDACKAWREMTDRKAPNVWSVLKVNANALINTDFADIGEKDRLALSIGEARYDRDVSYHDCLYTQE
jgi:hypothetical protein